MLIIISPQPHVLLCNCSMHPLIQFAKTIDFKVIQYAQSLFLKITGNRYQHFLAYFPILYYVLCYYGKRQQTFGESLSMIKLNNSKIRLLSAILLQFIFAPKFPEYKHVFEKLNDILYYLFSVPGWLAIFNLKYNLTRPPLPFDKSKVFQYIGICSIVYYGIQETKRLAAMTISEGNESNFTCSLCLDPVSSITSFPCGHTSCWSCAVGWVQKQPKCYICREKCELQDLIMLNGS
eukprot:NODE_1_length_95616_cov_0.657642.p45 type:complete len:235 gc:universal NODE_1_length_95616_cov_0.657642:71257-71961(+)